MPNPSLKSITPHEFRKRFPDDDAARLFLEEKRWEGSIHCGYCSSSEVLPCKDQRPMPYRCRSCRKFFSVRTGTILEQSRLPLQVWLEAIHIMTGIDESISSSEFAKRLDITQKSAWQLAKRIGDAWIDNTEKDTTGFQVDISGEFSDDSKNNIKESRKLRPGKGSGNYGRVRRIPDTFDAVVDTTLTNETPVIITATHKGVMQIDGVNLECYVLEDGRRVFNKKGMASAIGLKSAGGSAFLMTMSRSGIGSHISRELLYQIENPILFNHLRAEPNHAYEADVLVEVCKAIRRAKDTGRLTKTQEGLYQKASAILNSFGKIGVVALIDEATGYQKERSPEALRILVEQYIEEEKREWQKEFPDEFYEELNRIYGSNLTTVKKSGAIVSNRPQHFARFTRDYIYKPFANGAVLEELDKLNPKIDMSGKRKDRFHQHLSEDYGIEKLRSQVRDVITLLKVSGDINEFKKLFKKRFPRRGDQLDLL